MNKPHIHPNSKLVPDLKRLEKGKPKSTFEERLAARRQKELEDIRDKMFAAINEYAALLSDKRLTENKSINDKDAQSRLLEKLPQLASEVDLRSRSEGTHALLTVCLNSIVLMRDDNNRLRFQNFELNKRLGELENKVSLLSVKEETED